MTILVIGGTGKVGEALVAMLVRDGAPVRVLCRGAERAAMVPAPAQAVVADLTQDIDEAARAFAGVDSVFMLNRPMLGEVPEGLLAVEHARAAGVRHFVFQSIHTAERMEHIPHVASKLAIERGIRRSGMAWTFVRPNYFFQNDLTARFAIETGRYTAPIGDVGVASVDARDIAETARICLTQPGHDSQSYNLVGPELLTGADCAAAWSQALGRDVRYDGDPARWREETRAYMPPWFNFDLAMMYRHLCAHGMPPEPGDIERVTALLGRPPRAYRDYVADQAEAWRTGGA